VAVVIVASFAYLSLGLDRLFSAEAGADMLRFLVSFFPPNLTPEYLAKVGKGALETLAISALGTLLAAAGAMFLALPASGRYGLALRNGTRFLLNVLRSVPELVWGALMVLAAGLGPFAGTLALALHTAGVLGRLFAETLENAPPEPAGALVESGATPALAFVYGTLPSILPQLVAYSLYRWEMNIRMAAILGFVGAGGLGQMLYFELSLFRQGEACTVILAMLLLVIVVDAVSALVRRGLARAHS
jgi:phosphonate transport system permease protein